MTLLRNVTSVAAACGLALFVAGSASAQPALPPIPPADGQGQTPDPTELVRLQKLHELHEDLSIRSDQESAWQGFADSLALPRKKAGPDPVQGADLTTPQRLELIDADLRENLAGFERHLAAAKKLYAVLTPEQRRTFDVLTKVLVRQLGIAS